MPVPAGRRDICRWRHVELQLLQGEELQERCRAAAQEVSPPFQEVGWKAGVQIWRITKYHAVHWPQELYGHFYDDDVFLLLHTGTGRTSRGTPTYNIHLWAGKNASDADFSAGVYIAAELDNQTNMEAIVHREVPGRETSVFVALFKHVTVWKGSFENSYLSKRGEAYSAKLLRWFKPDIHSDAIRIKEVPPYKDSLNSENIMFLDLGQQLYQWIGREANHDETLKANHYMEALNANRGGAIKTEVINEGVSPDHYFYFYLQDNPSFGSLVDSDDETAQRVSRKMSTPGKFRPILFRVDQTHEGADFKVVKEGKIDGRDYQGHPICVFDNGTHCFVCFDKTTDPMRKKIGMQYAHEYLRSTDHPLVPISVIKNGFVSGDIDPNA